MPDSKFKAGGVSDNERYATLTIEDSVKISNDIFCLSVTTSGTAGPSNNEADSNSVETTPAILSPSPFAPFSMQIGPLPATEEFDLSWFNQDYGTPGTSTIGVTATPTPGINTMVCDL